MYSYKKKEGFLWWSLRSKSNVIIPHGKNRPLTSTTTSMYRLFRFGPEIKKPNNVKIKSGQEKKGEFKTSDRTQTYTT